MQRIGQLATAISMAVALTVSTPAAGAAPVVRVTEPPAPDHVVFASTDVPVAIPDNDPGGATSSMEIAAGAEIVDLDLGLRIDHTFLGNLNVELTHIATGTSVLVIDRPGRPILGHFGCWEDNLDAVLDDEAATPVEEECLAGSPAIDGRFFPTNLLAAFDGESAAGEWTLHVSDHADNDIGHLVEWELHIEFPPPILCNGLEPTIFGTPGFDVLVGTDGDDVIVGMGGGDEIRAGAGDDTICAGAGASMIEGGPGDDWIDGGPGRDTVTYESAPAAVRVNLGARSAQGGDGLDFLVRIRNVIGSSHSDVLAGNSYDNVIEGRAGDDLITGKAGDDRLVGGVGDDQLRGRRGDDLFDGGTGTDTAAFFVASGPMTVDLTLGMAGGEGADVLFSIENIIGSRHDDVITGSAKANVINGAKGADTLIGNGGDDTLRGRQGDDVLDGGPGDDRLLGGNGSDQADGGPGDDVCRAEVQQGC